EHLPRHAHDWIGKEPFEEAVRAFHERLEASLGALASQDARAPAEWAGPIRAWLEGIYPRALDETIEPERQLAAALRSVRAALGLPGDAERLARDVHAACVILATRERRVFVSARRSAEGDPLAPSRLAFHRPASEVPARVARFLPHGDHAHARLADEDDLS